MNEATLSLSYGKDSLACLGAIEELKLPLTRIVHAEVWATQSIPGDPPDMVEFKQKADGIIKSRWGLEVEHVRVDYTYEDYFYKIRYCKNGEQRIYGFPIMRGNWCNDKLKITALERCKIKGIEYVGIASDEIDRQKILTDKKRSPLVEAGWTEEMCYKWCKENNLLAPIYNNKTSRGGCWFCHNKTIEELRELRDTYPELWELLMKWDNDSPTTFKPYNITVHDLDKRFEMEKLGLVSMDKKFRWKMVKGKDNN